MSGGKLKILLSVWMVLFVSNFGANASENNSSKNITMDLFMPTDKVLLDMKGKQVSHDVLKNKYVGFYFSASWCGPCKTFTSKLIKFRNENANEFEVIFISLDGSLTEKENYIKSSGMNWYTIDVPRKVALGWVKSYTRGKIPSLVVFAPSGECVTNRAGIDVVKHPTKNAFELWKTKYLYMKYMNLRKRFFAWVHSDIQT